MLWISALTTLSVLFLGLRTLQITESRSAQRLLLLICQGLPCQTTWKLSCLFPQPLLFSAPIKSQTGESRIQNFNQRARKKQGTLSRRCYRQTWHHTEAQLGQKLPEGLRGGFSDAELPSWFLRACWESRARDAHQSHSAPWSHSLQVSSFLLSSHSDIILNILNIMSVPHTRIILTVCNKWS